MRIARSSQNAVQATPRERRVSLSPCGGYEEESFLFTVELMDRFLNPPRGGAPGWYGVIVEMRPLEAPPWADRVMVGPHPSEQAALDAAMRLLARFFENQGPCDGLEVRARPDLPAPPPQTAPVSAPPRAAPPALPAAVPAAAALTPVDRLAAALSGRPAAPARVPPWMAV